MNSERHIASLVLLGAAAFGLIGCQAHAQGAAYSQADAPAVSAEGPTLVEVDGGVWVVQDYDEPIYFIDDDYWVFRSGVWYRSHAYNGGWVVVEERVVPQVIVHRDHRQYVHFHGAASAHRRAAPRREAPREAHDNHDEGHHEEAHHEEAHDNHEEHRDAHAEQHEEKRDERGKKNEKKKKK